MKYVVRFNQKTYEVDIEKAGVASTQVYAPEPVYTPTAVAAPAPTYTPVPTTVLTAPAVSSSGADIEVTSPMPGKIMTIQAAVGQSVIAGESLAVIEAMKMENEIVAPQAGTVKQILISQGTMVDTGDVLIVLN